MKTALIAVLAFAGAACSDVESTPPPPAGGGSCNAGAARSLVGRTASESVGRRARQLSGARVVRWLRPGQVVTMEFSADRLNLQLDSGDKVIRITCG